MKVRVSFFLHRIKYCTYRKFVVFVDAPFGLFEFRSRIDENLWLVIALVFGRDGIIIGLPFDLL